jgi:hypothetical protein
MTDPKSKSIKRAARGPRSMREKWRRDAAILQLWRDG